MIPGPDPAVPSAPNEPPLNTHLEQGLRWSVLNQLVSGVVGTVAVLAYSQLLQPENLGTFGLALLVFNGLYLLVEAPIRDAVVYYQEAEQEHGSAAFWLLLGFSIAAFALVLIFAGALARFYHSPSTAPLMRLMAVAFLFQALAVVPAAALLKRFRFALHEGLSLLVSLVLYAGWVTLAASGWGAWSLVAPTVLSAALWCGLVWRASGFRPQRRVSASAYADILRFSRNLFGSKLATYIRGYIDNAAAGTLGERALGFYSFGEDQSAFAVLSVGLPVANVALPILARLRDQRDAFWQFYLEMLRLVATLSTPMQIGVLALAELGVRAFFGAQWQGAVPILRAYLVVRLLEALLVVADSANSAAGRPDVRFKVDAAQLPLFVLATFVGLWSGAGIAGIAWALTVVRLLAGGIYFVVTLRVVGLEWKPALRYLLPSTLAGAGMGLFVAWLQQAGLVERAVALLGVPFGVDLQTLIGLVLAGIGIYFPLLFLIDRRGAWAVWLLARRILSRPAGNPHDDLTLG